MFLKGRSDLLWYYNFYEGTGTTIHDDSGNGYDGTASAAGWAKDKDGSYSFVMNGATNKRVIDLGQRFTQINGNFTIITWVKCGASQMTYADIFGCHDQIGSSYYGGVCQQNGSTLNQYTWGVGHTTNWGNTVVVTLTANKWQMLTYTRNSSTGNFKAFIDARQVDTNTDANTWATHPTQNWQIGRGWDHVDDRYWNGQMAFFAVILNELTLPEIKRIYRDTYIEA